MIAVISYLSLQECVMFTIAQPPPPHVVEQVATAMQRILTEVANEAAISSGWLRRQRSFTGASFVQTWVFACMDQPAVTTEALARMSGTVGISVSGSGIVQRCTPAALTLLQTVLEAAVAELISAEPVWLPLLRKVTGVYVLDSTVITLPDALAERWRGCGGHGPQAALKVQAVWDLTQGTLARLDLEQGRTHDSASAAQWTCWPAGSVRVADLGSVNRTVFARLQAAGVLVVSRLKVGTRLTNGLGRPLDVLATLRQHPADAQDLAVRLDGRPWRVIALPAPTEVAATRRRKLREAAARRRQVVSQAQWDWAEWTVLLTNALPTQLSAAEILTVYRARWQIELLFKLWKEHGRVDEVRSQQPWRVGCEVLAKLLALGCEHWVLLATAWAMPQRSIRKVVQGIQSYALAFALALSDTERLQAVIRTLHRSLQSGSRLNPRKRRPATYQRLLSPHLGYLT
jgi:hypothetical protein